MKHEEKERLYEEAFPPYFPTQPFTLHFINSMTPENELTYLCDVIKTEIYFVLDTESDIHGYVPALIQLLVMSTSSTSYFMLLIETCFLPNLSSKCFDIIKDLFRNVFRGGTYLYSWGTLKSELNKFKNYQLFPSSILSNLIDVQALFTKWFDWFLMEQMDCADATNGADDSLIINAPESMFELFLSKEEINQLKITNNQLWSLQDSIAYTLHKYLSKRDTCRSWAIGLDNRLSASNKNYSSSYRQRLIKYACHDCSSLMELIWFMYEQYFHRHPNNETYVRTLGEYFSFLKQKFTSPTFSSGTYQQQCYDALFYDTDDESDDVLTAHELDEHQSSSLNHPAIQQQIAPDIAASQQMIIVDQPSNSPAIVSPVLGINQHDDIPIAQQKTKRKARRSAEARKRCNQKSSSRHRRNRYRFELQRSTNMDVTTVKKILHEYKIKYTNVNPVQSVIFIGVKSQQQQQLYDQLLPVDVFLRT